MENKIYLFILNHYYSDQKYQIDVVPSLTMYRAVGLRMKWDNIIKDINWYLKQDYFSESLMIKSMVKNMNNTQCDI